VYRLAYRLAGDDELAQEFTQDTFIRAFERLDRFRGDAGLATWLHAITVSVALNGLRKVRRQRERETDLDDNLVHPEAAMHARFTLKHRLARAIDALPDQHRTAFLMHYMEGYSHSEIGTVLAVATGTSKSLVSRACTRLRAALADTSRGFLC
jgi:RNA polymerase sigma-70 factor (ECF subfamily)